MTRMRSVLHAISVILLSAANISYAEERFEVIDYCPSDWKISSSWGGLNITKDAKKIVGTYIDTNGKEHGLIIQDKKCVAFDYPGAEGTRLGAANTRGELVGMNISNSPSTSDVVYGAFLYQKGRFIALRDSQPTGITSKGDILVQQDFDECSGSFLLKKKTAIRLPLPGTCNEFGWVYSAGINDNGVVVGYYYISEPEFYYGGFILKKGKVTTIKYPGTDGSGTQLTGINNKNEIVGYNVTGRTDTDLIATGFVYRRGAFKTIMVPGAISTMPTAISDKGSVVVGTFVTADNTVKGFLYYPK